MATGTAGVSNVPSNRRTLGYKGKKKKKKIKKLHKNVKRKKR